MPEHYRIVINANGEEREVKTLSIFPDKKEQVIDPERVDRVIYESSKLMEEFNVGQTEARFVPKMEYPDRPYFLLLMTDTHYGSMGSDVGLINEHLEMVATTSNFGMVHNGDNVDNFNATGKWASAMMENPLPPQIVSRAWAQKIKKLDELGKIGVLGFGNHDDFGSKAGQDWYESFLGGFQCPIFTTGGMLHIQVGEQEYKLAMTHKYWGVSKLNPNNACRRFLEHEHPDADIVFLGHTHQSAGEQFERAGKPKVAVIGGTYKSHDDFGRKNGISGHPGSPGWCVALWPNKKQMQLFKDVDVAKDYINALIK